MNEWVTAVFVEQSLASPGSSKNIIYVPNLTIVIIFLLATLDCNAQTFYIEMSKDALSIIVCEETL